MYTDEKLLYFNEDPSNAVFNCNGMGILIIDLNNINLDDTNYEENDPDTINCSHQTLAWHIKFEKCKALKEKISEELMTIWWDSCVSNDEKKK